MVSMEWGLGWGIVIQFPCENLRPLRSAALRCVRKGLYDMGIKQWLRSIILFAVFGIGYHLFGGFLGEGGETGW